MTRTSPASLGRSVIVAGVALTMLHGSLLVRTPVAAAQADSHCDPSLPVSIANPLGYRLRGDRCEGVFVQEVSATQLAVVSFGRLALEVSPDVDDALTLEWGPASGEVRLRAYALKPRTYYRMDAHRPAGSRSYRWPTDVVAALDLAAEDIGVVALTTAVVGSRMRDVHMPVLAGRPAGQPNTYDLLLMPGAELREVFVAVSAVGADGAPEPTRPMPLNYGYYPAGRSIRVPVGPLAAPGIYFVEIGATLRAGGAVSHELWFVHPPE